jgi:hypothetical protein
MKQYLKEKYASNRIYAVLIILFTVCITLNAILFLDYGRYHYSNSNSEPMNKTINVCMVERGETSYFSDRSFEIKAIIPGFTDIYEKVCSLFADADILGGWYLQAVLFLILLIIFLSLSVSLPDDFTLINRKIRLNN